MSRGGLSSNSGGGFRSNYGATTSTNSSTIPDVNFAGFSPTEFIGLSENIAQNIQKVKSSWLELDKSLKKIGTNRDNQEIRDKIQQLQVTTNQVITITSKDLHRLTAVVRRGDKQQKLQVEKLTSDFKMVVEKYSASQQQIAVKMKSIILRKSSIQDDMNRDSMESNDFDKELVQKQIQARNLQFEQDMLIERENSVREIEANVLDVNQIMRELNSLINQQGEAVGKFYFDLYLFSIFTKIDVRSSRFRSRPISSQYRTAIAMPLIFQSLKPSQF